MESKEILKKINAIVCEILGSNDIVLHEKTTSKDVEGWDSLTNIQIITAIEKKFGVRFKLNEILDFKDIKDICTTLMEKITI